MYYFKLSNTGYVQNNVRFILIVFIEYTMNVFSSYGIGITPQNHGPSKITPFASMFNLSQINNSTNLNFFFIKKDE